MSDTITALGALSFWHAILILLLARLVAILTSRVFRMVMVACRGWPPSHLDADGDWKPKDEEDDA